MISIHPHEAALQHAKARQKDPAWQQAYRTHIAPSWNARSATSPTAPGAAEKPAAADTHRILTDILTRASAINLARLATLGLHHAAEGWAIA